MLWLWSFLTSKAGLITVAAILLLGSLWAYGHYREERGKEMGRAEQLEEDKKAWDKERADLVENLEEWRGLAEQAQRRYEAALEREGVYKAQILDLRADRERVRAEVSRLTPIEQFQRITAELGIRHPDDTRSEFLPQELQELALCVAERPICEQTLKAQEGQIEQLRTQVEALAEKVAVVEKQNEGLLDYTVRLESHYVAAYNVAQRVRRKPWIIRLFCAFQCGDPKIDLPEPGKLKGEK